MAAAEQFITENLDIWSSAVQTKSAAGRGKSNKLELYGIKKLRELILELAVRGLLVAQDPNDEPASELLKKIAAEKAKLAKEGKIKKQKVLPAIEDTETPFELPDGWTWTRIAEIAQVGPRNEALDDAQVSFIPMSLITTNFDGRHGQEIREWSEVKKGYTHFADGDLAIAKITPCFENSKAAIFSKLKNGIGAGTTELHVARPYGAFMNRQYVLLYLKAPQFLSVGEGKMTGTAGQKRVPKNFFALNPLPFPPLIEQDRIVAKVDELMTLCDQLEQQQESSITAHQTLVQTLLDALTTATDRDGFIAAWARIADHFYTLFTTEWSIDQLKQTILQLAVTGNLVPQDSIDEPASELLKKVAAERAKLLNDDKIRERKSRAPIKECEIPHNLPSSWAWVRFGEVAVIERGGSPRPIKSFITDDPDGLNWIKIGDTNIGGKYITSTQEKIRKEGLAKTRMVYPGDFLLTNSMSFGRPYITKIEGCIHDGWLRISPSPAIDKDFLYLLLSSPYIAKTFQAYAAGAVVMNLNADKVREVVVLVPPLPEQNRIAAKVDELMALCDTLKTRINTAQATQLNLAEAIAASQLG